MSGQVPEQGHRQVKKQAHRLVLYKPLLLPHSAAILQGCSRSPTRRCNAAPTQQQLHPHAAPTQPLRRPDTAPMQLHSTPTQQQVQGGWRKLKGWRKKGRKLDKVQAVGRKWLLV